MQPVKLSKVTLNHIVALQAGVEQYQNHLQNGLNPQMSLHYFDTVLQLDILVKIFRVFRSKIEGHAAKFTISLRPSEAVVLLYTCQHMETQYQDGSYESNTARIYKGILDQQLISLNKWKTTPPHALPLP